MFFCVCVFFFFFPSSLSLLSSIDTVNIFSRLILSGILSLLATSWLSCMPKAIFSWIYI